MAKTPKAPLQLETRLVTAGRDPKVQHGFVNPPVYHASTVLYPTAEDQVAHRARYQYGRRGTPTTEALETALRELEGEDCAGLTTRIPEPSHVAPQLGPHSRCDKPK